MEWVETTGVTVNEAKDLALDRLGVDEQDAEFEVIDEPRLGLFGRVKDPARVRARVKPKPAAEKDERRRGRQRRGGESSTGGRGGSGRGPREDRSPREDRAPRGDRSSSGNRPSGQGRKGEEEGTRAQDLSHQDQGPAAADSAPPASIEELATSGVDFVRGLCRASGVDLEVASEASGNRLVVTLAGQGVGTFVGRGGRTLAAVQELTRLVVFKSNSADDVRLLVEPVGYRELRNEALGEFVAQQAARVRESGTPVILEPMNSVDRKVVHDAATDMEGVATESEGTGPERRVVVRPA